MKYILMLAMFLVTLDASAAKKKSGYKKTQEVTFESTEIDGLARSPDGAYVNQKKGVKFLPLYKVDKSFDREIKKSPEYLR
jgi:hypothetical protein